MKNISYGSKVKLIWGVSKNQGGLETFLSLFFSFQKFVVRILAQMTPFQPSVVRVYRLAACTQHFFICSSNTNELMFERVWGTEYSFIDRQPNQKKGQNAPNLATPSGPKRVNHFGDVRDCLGHAQKLGMLNKNNQKTKDLFFSDKVREECQPSNVNLRL